AAIEIRTLCCMAVKRLDDCFGSFGCLVQSAIAEVDHLFGMLERPTRIYAIGLMSCIRSGGGVTAFEITCHGVEIDCARETAVPHSQVLSVPIRSRHPHFEMNIRVGCRFDNSR